MTTAADAAPAAATDTAALDRAVETLAAGKQRWAERSVADRLDLLYACRRAWVRVAPEMVRAGCLAKGLDPDAPESAEEWLSGPLSIVRNIRLLIQSLEQIRDEGRPALRRGAIWRLANGALAVNVFPRHTFERLFYPGVQIDVWMEPGLDEDHLHETRAGVYRADAPREGRLALVLGAGNVASIGPMDALHKLFVESQAAIVKMHPVNAYLGPFVERGFRPLIDAAALRVVYGDAAEGSHLVHHPDVDEIHITGSAAVHDRIVWGETAGEQATRRAAGTPKVTKRVTSELGCVTPVIVVPGRWTDAEIGYHADNVATMVALNASCNCNAAKLIVTWKDWPQRRVFLDRLAQILAALPPRQAYYPGSLAKYDRFGHAHPEARALGPRGPTTLPFTTIFDVDPQRTDDIAFTEEAWCPILAETALAADDAAHFLEAAVSFCNDTVQGTLSCVLLADPDARVRLGSRFDAAVAALRYGTVAVNHWSAMSYVLAVAPWGAFPGHTLASVGSGLGVVHNTLMLPRPQKTVLWGPFTSWPRPAWFVTHRRRHEVARRMVPFEASPAAWRVPGIGLAALRR